jgi:glycosyltransferase involved in cell wall biosynthesis
MDNRVTVVIPTRNRPQLVVRAVRSALAQTHQVEEVVVVVDGTDDATVSALEAIGDPRLRWVVLEKSSGANHARNVGASSSVSSWIAFLDDDDEWLSHKIEAQLAVADKGEIISCRFIAHSSEGMMVWPKRLPAEEDNFGNYLFARRSIFNGEAAIITSTLMVHRRLFDAMPFSTTLRRHQDADWVMRATSGGARIVYAPQALVRFDDELGRARVSTSYDWCQSLDWIRSVRGLLSHRAYAGFVLTSVGAAASDKREWRAFPVLLGEAFARGLPTFLHLALYLGMWVFPQRTRQRVRAIISSITWHRTEALFRQGSRP